MMKAASTVKTHLVRLQVWSGDGVAVSDQLHYLSAGTYVPSESDGVQIIERWPQTMFRREKRYYVQHQRNSLLQSRACLPWFLAEGTTNTLSDLLKRWRSDAVIF